MNQYLENPQDEPTPKYLLDIIALAFLNPIRLNEATTNMLLEFESLTYLIVNLIYAFFYIWNVFFSYIIKWFCYSNSYFIKQ